MGHYFLDTQYVLNTFKMFQNLKSVELAAIKKQNKKNKEIFNKQRTYIWSRQKT